MSLHLDTTQTVSNTLRMERDRRYQRRADVHFTTLPDGSLALLDVRRSVFHGCNEVGSRIWDMLAEPRTLDEIVARLVEEYEVDAERCTREAQDFFGQLVREELVRACGS